MAHSRDIEKAVAKSTNTSSQKKIAHKLPPNVVKSLNKIPQAPSSTYKSKTSSKDSKLISQQLQKAFGSERKPSL